MDSFIKAETATYISAEGLNALVALGIIEIDDEGNKHVREDGYEERMVRGNSDLCISNQCVTC